LKKNTTLNEKKMQTITPNRMLCTMIGMFTESPEVHSLLFESEALDITSWLHNTHATEVIAGVMKRLAWLETFTTQLEGIMQSSKEKELTFELRLRDGDKTFERTTCRDIQDCLFSAYGRKLAPKNIGPAYFAVLIRDSTSSAVIATALADFLPYPDIEFATRMEAVTKSRQRQNIAKSIFIFTEIVVRFLITADGFVQLNMAGLDPSAMTIKSCVDADAPAWHIEMMGKMGFQDTSCGWNEEEFEFSKSIE
jgi:hypothetical protein